MSLLILCLAEQPTFSAKISIDPATTPIVYCLPGYKNDSTSTPSKIVCAQMTVDESGKFVDGACVGSSYTNADGGLCMRKCPNTLDTKDLMLQTTDSQIFRVKAGVDEFCQICPQFTVPVVGYERCLAYDTTSALDSVEMDLCDAFDSSLHCAQCISGKYLQQEASNGPLHCVSVTFLTNYNGDYCLKVDKDYSAATPATTDVKCIQCDSDHKLDSNLCTLAQKYGCATTDGINCIQCLPDYLSFHSSANSLMCIQYTCDEEGKMFDPSLTRYDSQQCKTECKTGTICYETTTTILGCAAGYYNDALNITTGELIYDDNGIAQYNCLECPADAKTCTKRLTNQKVVVGTTSEGVTTYNNAASVITSCVSGKYLNKVFVTVSEGSPAADVIKYTLACTDFDKALPNCSVGQYALDSENLPYCLKCKDDAYNADDSSILEYSYFLYQGHCFTIKYCEQKNYYVETRNKQKSGATGTFDTVQCKCYNQNAYFNVSENGIGADDNQDKPTFRIDDGIGNFQAIIDECVSCSTIAPDCAEGHCGTHGPVGSDVAWCVPTCQSEWGDSGIQCTVFTHNTGETALDEISCKNGLVLNHENGKCIPKASHCATLKQYGDITATSIYIACTTCDDYYDLIKDEDATPIVPIEVGSSVSQVNGLCAPIIAGITKLKIDTTGTDYTTAGEKKSCLSGELTPAAATAGDCDGTACLHITAKLGNTVDISLYENVTDFATPTYLNAIFTEKCNTVGAGFYRITPASGAFTNVQKCNPNCSTCNLADGDANPPNPDKEPAQKCLKCANNYAKAAVFGKLTDEATLEACTKIENPTTEEIAAKSVQCNMSSLQCNTCSARDSNPFCRICDDNSFFFNGICTYIKDCGSNYHILDITNTGVDIDADRVSCNCPAGSYLSYEKNDSADATKCGTATFDRESAEAEQIEKNQVCFYPACKKCSEGCRKCEQKTDDTTPSGQKVETRYILRSVNISTESVCLPGFCEEGYAFDATTQQCYKTPTNCLVLGVLSTEAPIQFTCSSCFEGYGTDSTGACVRCDRLPNCATCSFSTVTSTNPVGTVNMQTCTTCISGVETTLSSVNLQFNLTTPVKNTVAASPCDTAPTTIDTATSEQKAACYIYTGQAKTTACLPKCPIGFYRSSTGSGANQVYQQTCSKCSSNQATCTYTSNTWTQSSAASCFDGYKRNGTAEPYTCASCEAGCSKCDFATGECATVKEGYIKGADNKVYQCPIGCKACTEASGVTTCYTPLTNDSDCLSGYFYSATNPESGDADKRCYKICELDQMHDSFQFHDEDNLCQKCNLNGCNQCVNYSTCAVHGCQQKYQYDNGKCLNSYQVLIYKGKLNKVVQAMMEEKGLLVCCALSVLFVGLVSIWPLVIKLVRKQQ